MYKLPRYTNIGNIELLLDDHYERVERQAIAVEFYRLMLDVLVKAFNLRQKVRYTHLGDLIYYAFNEVTDNSLTITILFDYTLELFERISRYFARLGLEEFVHYLVVTDRPNALYGYDHIKIDFESTAAWLAVRQWDAIQVENMPNVSSEDVSQVVSEAPTQEQLDALYDSQNNSTHPHRN